MNKDIKLIIILLVLIFVSIGIFIYFHPKEIVENKNITIQIINESNEESKVKVCYNPISCFKDYESFAKQFPYNQVPETYPECLVICFQ